MCECERFGQSRPVSVAVGWLLMIAQLGYAMPAVPAPIREPDDAANEHSYRLPASPGSGRGLRVRGTGAQAPDGNAWRLALASIDAAPKPPVVAGAADAQQSRAGDGQAGEPGALPWRLPPIRWGGNLANEFRQQQSGDQSRRRQMVDIANLRAGTYLWQPWFAQVTGGIGLVNSRERGNAAAGAANAESSGSTSATGNGTLAVFPASRFPFQAMFDVSDSRASGELTRSDFTSMRVGLRQNYQTPRGDANYTGSYDRSTLRSSAFGRDTVDVLALGMAKNAGEHTYDVTGNHTRNQRMRNGEGSLLNRLTARHSFRPEPTFSVESMASTSSSGFRLANTGGAFSETSTRFLQLNSFATWRPEEGHPLFVTGGGRVFQSTLQNNGAESESRSLNGYAAANYAVSRNLNVGGSASVTQAVTAMTHALITNQAGTATYLPDLRRFGKYLYTQNATATVVNQTGGREGARQNVAGQIGHNLARVFALRENSALSVNLAQSLASNFDTVTAVSETLAHNAGVAWRLSPSPATSTYVAVMAADSRTRGHNENDFQLLNAQASGQIQFGRYAYAGANLTMQGTRQHTPASADAPFNWNTNGNLNYQHQRAFNVAGLRYFATYNVNETQYRSRLLGDVNAPRERVSQSFEQRLLYNIGRVEVRLTMRVATIEGERNSLIFLRVSRQIGNF